ncbi:MAG: hypothetical protein QXW97_01060 [Candidatus Pacearchaeota archaeon]
MIYLKKGAIELSIGTIVIIVLAMSMLILGLVVIKQIFGGALDITRMTDEQVKNQIIKMFGEEDKLVIYPDSKHIDVKIGKSPGGGFGIGIRNLIEGESNTKFSYEVYVSDDNLRRKCGATNAQADDWIVTGKSESNIPIAPGDIVTTKVLFNVPLGTQLCTLRYRIVVKANGNDYATDFIDVTLKPK